VAETVCYIYTFSTWSDPRHYTTLLNADVLNFYLTLHLLQSDCSDLVSKWRGHTVTTTFLLRGHCQTCTGRPCRSFLCFNRTAPQLVENTMLLLSWCERETRHRLSACVRVCGADFEHAFWEFWADLPRQLITLLNKPYFSLLCANSVVR